MTDLGNACFFFLKRKGDRIQRQISTRADDDSVRMQRVKHNLAGDAKESRWREKQKHKITGKCQKQDNMDHPINTEYFLSGRVSASKFIVDVADAVGSFVMRSFFEKKKKNTNSLEHQSCR